MDNWTWGPLLHALFRSYGLKYQILQPGESIPDDLLGSSPGDAYYDGERVIIEHGTYTPWVAHELAHWLYCRVCAPEYLNKRNYGFDEPANDYPIDAEPDAAVITCGLLIHIRYPWRQAYDDMSLSLEICGGGRPPWYDRLVPERIKWKVARAECLSLATAYMDLARKDQAFSYKEVEEWRTSVMTLTREELAVLGQRVQKARRAAQTV